MMMYLAVISLWIGVTLSDDETHQGCPTTDQLTKLIADKIPYRNWCTDAYWCVHDLNGKAVDYKNSACGCYYQKCWKWCRGSAGLAWCYMRQGACTESSQCHNPWTSYNHAGCKLKNGQADCSLGRLEIPFTEDLGFDLYDGHLYAAVALVLVVCGLFYYRSFYRKTVDAEYEPLIDNHVAA